MKHSSDFQIKVWQEIEKIPYGETRTYKDIAIAIGKPNAYSCLLYTSPSPRDYAASRMPSSA